ncbi:hypothetical protein [Azorhizobium oxalatiphilum]|nr:hypothetical protein [Azorhizobium oxalatiphilum]
MGRVDRLSSPATLPAMHAPDAVARLHATLPRRETPEAVADLIAQALPEPLRGRLQPLFEARKAASLQSRFGWSSMPTLFPAPVPPERQVAKAQELALLFLGKPLPDLADMDQAEDLLSAFNMLINRPAGAGFRDDRMNREARTLHGLDLSRRRYDKLFRVARRLEARLAAFRRIEARYPLLLVSKAALAPDLTPETFGGHLPSLAFVAYYAARLKLRSEFTFGAQQKPFDDLAAALLELCLADRETRWFAIAHVFPRADVLAHLSEAEKGHLLGRWFAILAGTAEELEAVWRRSSINLATMVVKRGDDSSTWNVLAGAWNRARDHWIALVDALGMDALFDQMMPGKVMRLMAADVAAGHAWLGGGLHPDTRVWADLPKPWQVLQMEQTCTRHDIAAACARHGVDPEKSGWSAPRPRKAVAAFHPTPELVHGVSVGNPYMATLLKRMGAYSGRPMKPEVLRSLGEG